MTDIRFVFESLQYDDAKALGFASEGPFANAARVRGGVRYYALTAYGRCLRPALYSSLRSSPSHPAGVSALRVTIAIANARFARAAFFRKSPRVPRVCWLGSWALGTSDRGGQDKSRKVRRVGSSSKHQQIPMTRQTLRMASTTCESRQRATVAQLSTPYGGQDDR